MQESVNRYADGVRRTEGVPIQIRVGLNSGEVVVGAIGNDLKMDYTAIGQTVHLASRMEQMATPGTIMLATDSLRLAEGYVDVALLQRLGLSSGREVPHSYRHVGQRVVKASQRLSKQREVRGCKVGVGKT